MPVNLESLLEEECDGIFDREEIGANIIREIYAIAIKHILPDRNWNHSTPIVAFRNFRGLDLRDHPMVADLNERFCQVTHEELCENDQLNKCIRQKIRWKNGLSHRRVKRRVRKKRVRRFVKEFRLLFQRSNRYDRNTLKGMLYFSDGVLATFLTRERRKG